MLIAQVSDCHIEAPGELFGGQVDSADGLRAALATIAALQRRPDVVLATGDLVNDGTPAQYDHLDAILDGFDLPIVPVMGNHDERSELRRRFPDVLPAGADDEPVAFTVDLGGGDGTGMRLVVLDTTTPGRHDGSLDDEQLAWLDARLAERPAEPTIVVQHHPPFASGISWMDDGAGFASAAAEHDVVARHGHVEAVIAGHLHRSMTRRFAGSVAMTCPSTAAALDLDLATDEVGYSTEPTGLLLHDWDGCRLLSHVVAIGDHRRWQPTWAT